MSTKKKGAIISIGFPRVVEEVKIGPPYLTKYERARMIGIRALQLSYGAPPLAPIEKIGSTDPILIAKYEVDNGLLPISVLRYTSSGERQTLPLKLLIELSRRILGRVE
ncbi:MAG: DNA-directed RNA polymerase subunit K [Acidilobaceae archaeon]